MDDLCQLCRGINLYTLGAFYHKVRFETDEDGDPDVVDDHCITRTRDQLNADCPLCQLFLNPDGSPPRQEVARVTITAEEPFTPEPAHVLSLLWGSFVEWSRAWLIRFGRTRYYPLSQILVEVYYQGQDYAIPLRLDVFVDQGECLGPAFCDDVSFPLSVSGP